MGMHPLRDVSFLINVPLVGCYVCFSQVDIALPGGKHGGYVALVHQPTTLFEQTTVPSSYGVGSDFLGWENGINTPNNSKKLVAPFFGCFGQH